jgi:hypothetical protein
MDAAALAPANAEEPAMNWRRLKAMSSSLN